MALLLLLCWILTAAAQPAPDAEVPAPDAPPEEPEPEPEPEPVRILFTGASEGFGTGQYQFDLLTDLRRVIRNGGDLVAVTPHHGVMVRGDWLLMSDDQRIAPLIDLLQEGGIQCGEVLDTARLMRGRLGRLLVRQSTAPDLAERLADRTEPFEVRRCRGQEGSEAWLAGPAGRPVLMNWRRFEIRVGITATARMADRTQSALLVGLPEREATRRATLLTDLRAQHPDALFVDAGAFLDGTSRAVDHALSLHRPTAIALLERLRPAALAPGRTELVGGARQLLREAPGLPWVATNWRVTDPTLELPRSLRATVGDREVAFLGVVDPALLETTPLLRREGVDLIDPVAAVQEEAASLRAGERPPDLIVLLTTARGDQLERLQQEARGVDVIIGDAGPRTERLAHLEVTLRPAEPDAPPALTLPLPEVGLAEIHLPDREIQQITAIPHQVTADLPSDPEILSRINRVRFAQYPLLDRPLLPAAPDRPLEPMPQGIWEKVACESVLEHTGADLALLPALPERADIPGPLTELMVLDHLALLDVLEVHNARGGAIRHLLERARRVVPVICGVPQAGAPLQIAGRPIENDRRYRVVTTDRLRATHLEGPLTEAGSNRLLDQPNFRTFTDAAGQPVTLRRAVLQTLREHRDDVTDPDPVVTLLARSPATRTPQWVLRASPISFSLERFQGAEEEAFEQIPFTLATAPSVLTLRTYNDVQLEYSSTGVIWDARVRAQYTRLRTEEVTEPNDDLRLSSSVQLPTFALPLPPVSPRPFADLLYDTEFTPDEVDGELRPHQRDLYLTAGLSSTFGAVRTVRVGAFALRDLSRLERPFQLGARADLNTRVGFGPGLFWNNLIEAFVYADTPDQDQTDLRFRTFVDSRVELPLAWWLSTALYGRAFLFSGRVPETDMLGLSWTLGISLDVSGAFSL